MKKSRYIQNQSRAKEFEGWESFCITINTDASYLPYNGQAGYAFWMIVNDQRLKMAGKFKCEIKDALDAEIAAIGNALSYLLSLEKIPTAKWLIINTDCKGAIHHIQNHPKPRPLARQVRTILGQVKKTVRPHKTKIKHVPAHGNNSTTKGFVNNWCDNAARTHAKKENK